MYTSVVSDLPSAYPVCYTGEVWRKYNYSYLVGSANAATTSGFHGTKTRNRGYARAVNHPTGIDPGGRLRLTFRHLLGRAKMDKLKLEAVRIESRTRHLKRKRGVRDPVEQGG